MLARLMNLTQDMKKKYSAESKEQVMDEHDFDRIFQATKMIKPEDVDIILAKSKLGQNDLDQKEQMCRYEFAEMLIRISVFRYKDRFMKGEEPLATSFIEAINMLHSQVLKPFYEEVTNVWLNFRQGQLWTLDINNLYIQNMSNLHKLFNRYVKRPTPKRQQL